MSATRLMTYTGRFAPSPSGPLHLGSLVAALGSYLDARTNRGLWLLRMEDLDPPREVPEAKTWIPKQLENHGLTWDRSISYQSERLDLYQSHLEKLDKSGFIYQCFCSRQRVKELGGTYDGHCRNKLFQSGNDQPLTNRPTAEATKAALRVHLDNPQSWDDLIQGFQSYTPEQLHGDFVVKRRDGLFSYQLAVAVDDSLQGITHVIRGADLIDSAARQIHLQKLLGLSSPDYGHLPVVENDQGQKLSKQNLARSLDETTPAANLVLALKILGQQPPAQLEDGSAEEILGWAGENWNRAKIPAEAEFRVTA